jgi:hypothetical protein
MASTHLKNSALTYKSEQLAIHRIFDNKIYNGKILHNKNCFPGLGINAPIIHNGINNNVLSNNGSDIESALFGIGSTNLVQPKAPVCANMNHLNTLDFFEIKPESNNIIPEPLVVHDQERYTIFRR